MGSHRIVQAQQPELGLSGLCCSSWELLSSCLARQYAAPVTLQTPRYRAVVTVSIWCHYTVEKLGQNSHLELGGQLLR